MRLEKIKERGAYSLYLSNQGDYYFTESKYSTKYVDIPKNLLKTEFVYTNESEFDIMTEQYFESYYPNIIPYSEYVTNEKYFSAPYFVRLDKEGNLVAEYKNVEFEINERSKSELLKLDTQIKQNI